MASNQTPDVSRTVLQVLGIGAMIFSCAWILSPFLLAAAWATMIVVATWPLLLGLQDRLGGKRSYAVALMTGALLVILVLPLSAGVAAIVGNVDTIREWSTSVTTFTVPAPPSWLGTLPLIGPRTVSRWQQLAAMKPEEMAASLAPYAGSAVEWGLARIGSLGMMLVQFLLTVIITAILYANGEVGAAGLLRFAGRLAGERGEGAVNLAGQAVRAVALGVVVTAIVQAALGGIGLAAAGIPFTSILTVVMFVLCIGQLGPALVLLPAVGWVYWHDGALWGTVLLAWALPVGLLDNFLRPMLIRRGADLPMLLIFSGVIGGLIAFGIIGLFVGPVVLAVSYTLLSDWVSRGEGQEPAQVPAQYPAQNPAQNPAKGPS